MIDFSTSSLKEIRQHLGFTQQELAEKLGYTRNYIAIIESGGPEKFTSKLRNRIKSTVELSTERENKPTSKTNINQHVCDQCVLKDEEITRLRNELAIAHERDKDLREIIKNLSRNGAGQ